MMTGDQDLAKRVQMLEDRLDILQLIMSYTLALNSGAEKHCRSAWAETGRFDEEAVILPRTAADIRALMVLKRSLKN
jgi:uncharacterized protein with PhoU and TrkA domain